MNIIDFRFSLNIQSTFDERVTSQIFKNLFTKERLKEKIQHSLKNILNLMEKHNVIKGVITGCKGSTGHSTAITNLDVINIVRALPNKFLGFMEVHPHEGMLGIRNLSKQIEEEGMHGAAINPYLIRSSVHDARNYPVYAKCCDLDIPIIISTGPATLVSGPAPSSAATKYIDYQVRDIDYVARDFPELKIIIRHGGYPLGTEVIIVTERNKNVYLELSEYQTYPLGGTYITCAANLIGDKLLFATAHPNPGLPGSIARYKNMGLDQDTLDRIFYLTAKKLLNL